MVRGRSYKTRNNVWYDKNKYCKIPERMIVENIILQNVIIKLGCTSVDYHGLWDDIFHYHPLRNVISIYYQPLPWQTSELQKWLIVSIYGFFVWEIHVRHNKRKLCIKIIFYIKQKTKREFCNVRNVL